jgi:tetratricopeptide (TPR) repeat protein
MVDINNTDISVALVGFLGTAVGALASFIGTYYSNKKSMEKDRQQWLNEKEKERELWLRDRLRETYVNCIDALSKIEQQELSIFDNEKKKIDYSEAIKWLNILLINYPKRNSKEYREFYNRVMEFSRTKVAGSAARALRADIIEMASDQESTVYWFNKCNYLLEKNDFEKAIECYSKVIERDQDYTEAWVYKGSALTQYGEHLQKIKQIEKAKLAFGEAIASYDKAIEKDPSNREFLLAKSYSLNRLERYGESIDLCNKLIEKYPDLVSAWINKGYAMFGSGHYDDAITAYDKVIELNHHHAGAWYNKGEALRALGHVAEADDAYAKAKELGYEG